MLYIQNEKIIKEIKDPTTDEILRSVVLEEICYISFFNSKILRFKISRETARKLIGKGS